MINFLALFIGIVVAVLIIVSFKQKGLEQSKKAYPILLATFPIYYWCFAIYDLNVKALLTEIYVGLFFIFVAGLAYKLKKKASLYVLAIGLILHGVYDVVHLYWNQKPITPAWWAEFCGAVDILVGLYVFWLSQKDVALSWEE